MESRLGPVLATPFVVRYGCGKLRHDIDFIQLFNLWMLTFWVFRLWEGSALMGHHPNLFIAFIVFLAWLKDGRVGITSPFNHSQWPAIDMPNNNPA